MKVKAIAASILFVLSGWLATTWAAPSKINPIKSAARLRALPVAVPTTVYSPSAQWGTFGTGDGQFNWPVAVAVKNTFLYVTDRRNNRIQKLTTDGVFLTKWGSLGNGSGQFNEPNGVAVDSQGRVYVADSKNQRIQMFNENGGHIRSWGTYGSGNGQFQYPHAVVVDNSNFIYVTDNVNRRVQKFRLYKFFGFTFIQYVTQWPITWPQDASGPAAIALADSHLYVTMGSHIQKFTTDGTLVHQWGISGPTPPHFLNAMGLTGDNFNHLLVSDQGQSKIQQWTLGGLYLSAFGSSGSAPGQFHSCMGMAVDGAGNLYVADRDNSRVQKFAPN